MNRFAALADDDDDAGVSSSPSSSCSSSSKRAKSAKKTAAKTVKSAKGADVMIEDVSDDNDNENENNDNKFASSELIGNFADDLSNQSRTTSVGMCVWMQCCILMCICMQRMLVSLSPI